MKRPVAVLVAVVFVAVSFAVSAWAQRTDPAPSRDGTFDAELIRLEEPVPVSRLHEELAIRGYDAPEPVAILAPQVDTLDSGVAPEADLPIHAAITPNGSFAVTSFYISGNIGIQSLSTHAWVAMVDVGVHPTDVDITPSGSHALVVCQGSNAVVGVNLTTYAVDFTVPVGQGPVAAAIAPNGTRAIVLNSTDSSASILELTGWTVQTTVSSPPIASGVVSSAVNTLGRWNWEYTEVEVLGDSLRAAVPSSDRVHFVNLATGAVQTVMLPSSNNKDLSVSRNGARLAVAGYNSTAAPDVHFLDVTQNPPVVSGGIALPSQYYSARSLTFSAGGSLVALSQTSTSGGLTYLVFYDTSSYSLVYQCPTSIGSNPSIALSADGSCVLGVGYYALYVNMTGPVPVQMGSALAGNPEYLAASPAGPRAVSGASMVDENTAVYDISLGSYGRLDWSRPGPLPEGDGTRHLVMSPDGSVVVGAESLSDSVTIRDTITGDVTYCIDVGDQPSRVAISPDGRTALSCDFESYQVSILDVASGTVWKTLPSQRRPDNCVFSPDGTRAYVVTVGANPNDFLGAYQISGASSSWIKDIDLGLNMYGFYQNGGWTPNPAISADGSTLVVPGADPARKRAIVIDAATLTIVKSVDLSSSPQMPYYAAINPAGDRAVLVDGLGDRLHFISVAGASSALLQSMNPGDYPFVAIYSADGKYVYVNNRNSRNVVVIDTASYAIVATIPMPGPPTHMTASGGKLYVACDPWGAVSPSINRVSMAGPSSLLLATYPEPYYAQFIVAHDETFNAFTDCTQWDTYSWLHDPAMAPPAPPAADGASGSAMKLSKVGGDTLHVDFDAATCSDDHAVMLYGDLGSYSGYAGAVTSCDLGATGSANFDIAAGNVWFNLVWVNSTSAGGHPGYASGPVARSWKAKGLCAVTSDDHRDKVCNP